MTTVINTTQSETPNTVEQKKMVYKIYQLIWLLIGLLEVLLAFRLVFKLLAANRTGFVQFIYNLSSPFTAPFVGIFGTTVTDRSVLEWTTIVAMIVYAVLGYVLVAILRLMKPVNPSEAEKV